jgi:hypothetical protein
VAVSLRANHARLRDWAATEGLLIRVDRTTGFGNPFRLGHDGDRGTVIRAYEQHIAGEPALMAMVSSLKGCALACWCSPLPCHADVLARLAEQYSPH